MVASVTRIEGGGSQIISPGVQETIKSIQEVVGNHSDADIYVTLKETNMDPNESVHKLLHQDTFHEVKRRRDKNKEKILTEDSFQSRKNLEHVGQGTKKDTITDQNGRRDGYTRNSYNGRSREFRVVKDNRLSQNTDRELKHSSQQSATSANEQVNLSEKGSTGTSNSQKHFGRQILPRAPRATDAHLKPVRDVNSSGNILKESSEKPKAVSKTNVRGKPNVSQRHSDRPTSSNSITGVHSSSSDPIHVPSLDSRSSTSVGAIRREVGVVGVRKHSSEILNQSFIVENSFSNSVLGSDNASSIESVPPSVSKGNQLSHTTAPESVVPSLSVSRPFSSNQHGSRLVHQAAGHQKAFQPNKKWKPKSSNKSSVNNAVIVGLPAVSNLPSCGSPADNSKNFTTEAVALQDKLSQLDIFENHNVVIAEHIRVPETERRLLTFGSIGPGFQALVSAEEPRGEPSASLSAPVLEPLLDDTSHINHADTPDVCVANSGSHSSASGVSAEHHLLDKNESFSPQDLDGYSDIGIVRENCQFYAPSEPQQLQEASELPSFSTGYDIPYFRPTVDESLWGQGLPSPQEALGSYTANSIPASTISMVQQQQPSGSHMYPQVHVSHFANLMPYRQFISPVYVPPMGMPGYSNNPAYPHPSNGGSYLIMPGGNSHPNPAGLKYGIQQFKPLPSGTPTAYGNFTSPTGYAVNVPGVGGAMGIEDSSRLKYKDGNLYVSNPQAETSDIWIQNPRELPAMQSAPYYNMSGQTPHAAYMPSHNSHASFNPAAQSSHMQFQGMYHPPPQPAGLANPHHLAPAIPGNVAPPGLQVGAYQQPQLNHLNWMAN